MKILLFISQDISLELAKFFFRRKDIQLTVVTQVTPRDRVYGYKSAVEFCAKNKIPCWQPKRLDATFLDQARAFQPDMIVAAYFPQIFPKALLDIPRLGAVNVHPGDLPRYRGTFAIPWTILNGEKEFTATLHYLDAGVDSGDIIAKKKRPIPPDETGFKLYVRAMHACSKLLMESFDDLVKGKLPRKPQTGYGSYYNQLERRAHIDWQQSRDRIKKIVRVHAKPYLPARAYLINRCVYINKVSFFESKGTSAKGSGLIGKVFPDGRFTVACADGWLRVDEYDVYPPLDKTQFGLHFIEGARLD